MNHRKGVIIMRHEVIAVILGGGRGERLYPLTKYRAKPAVPIAGKFRLIDIPVSNCLHADLDRIFVLTQFNSTSLHRHIAQTYRFDQFSGGYVQILAAQQTQDNLDWYQGTADAVRQNLRRFMETPCEYILILSGDQLYRMDFGKMIQEHIEKDAEITVTALPVHRDRVEEFGILKTNENGRIVEFREKPRDEEEIKELEIEDRALKRHGIEPQGRSHAASMGIYLFNRETLWNVLVGTAEDKSMIDFGKHIIPASIKTRRIHAYYFDGYWQDVGTIRSFYETNLELTRLIPQLDFYNEFAQIYTRPRFLPGSKINSCVVQSSILCEGSIITECEIRNSIIGLRSIVNSGAEIHDSVIMGADYYETDSNAGFYDPTLIDMDSRWIIRSMGKLPPIGIGRGSIIRNAIIDKNARIGCNVKIVNENGVPHYDGQDYSIRDGVVVVHKDGVIPDNTVI